ncbi:uncharacterized protein FA14DRAFT_153836 [Meira miltonrushii]|uniref:Uncharacterized protein n=1 Tax=Meira miltonrushii TaxID=1280837 RepID=A0A316VQ27_9BASI|nr:uncharacterized protein FA14DRAFT_153836 [Meira miltonrushii]PWN38513.1 hypothetical protein FA14DRAFT_153836 [Meira miltonrushii]
MNFETQRPQHGGVMIEKRQVSKRTRRERLPGKNQKYLRAVKNFFEKDDLHLADAMEQQKLKFQTIGQTDSHSSSGFGHVSDPPSPTTQKVNELEMLLNAPPSPKMSHQSQGAAFSQHKSTLLSTSPRHSEMNQVSPPSGSGKEAQHSQHSEHLIAAYSPKSHSRTFASITTPFSKEVKRNNNGRRPKGYDSNANKIALFAETFLNHNKAASQEDAIRLAKEKLSAIRERTSNNLKNWKHIAKTEPSKAGEMKTNVPKHLPINLYVSARAHQLYHRGQSKDLAEAEKLAKAESVQFREKKRKHNAIYEDKRRQKKQA